MHRIAREKLIEVCSELVGERLNVTTIGRRKEHVLVSARDGSKKSTFPNGHGKSIKEGSVPPGTAYSVIRAVSNGDKAMYERGKKLLRSNR